MKKSILLIVALILVTVTAFAADVAQPTPNSVVMCDFENIPDGTVLVSKTPQDLPVIPDQVSIFYYDDSSAGKMSKLTATFVSDAAQGSKAMQIDWVLDGWCGIGLTVPAGQTGPMWDWEEAKSITFYAKSANGKKASFVIGLADAGDERFRAAVKTEVKGDEWVKFVIPMDKFRSRSDWQPDKAKRNTFIDSPGTNFEICPLSGTGSVIFDYIEVNY